MAIGTITWNVFSRLWLNLIAIIRYEKLLDNIDLYLPNGRCEAGD